MFSVQRLNGLIDLLTGLWSRDGFYKVQISV